MNIGHNSGQNILDVTRIAKSLIETSVTNYLTKQKVSTRTPLDILFPRERRVRSIMGGLETSLGTKFWEKLAVEISKENGFEMLNAKAFNSAVPEISQAVMHKLSDFEEEKKLNPSLEHQGYFTSISKFIHTQKVSVSKRKKIPKGTGVDLWIKKGGTEYLIDIKTVQINAGSGVKFNRNLLEWYTYSALDRVSHVQCLVAFPYNPYDEDYWKKEAGKVSPLMPGVEAKVESEFWDFLSGESETYSRIIKAFVELSREGFTKKFDSIFYK